MKNKYKTKKNPKEFIYLQIHLHRSLEVFLYRIIKDYLYIRLYRGINRGNHIHALVADSTG